MTSPQADAAKRLANTIGGLAGGERKKPYQSILKSLEEIGIDPIKTVIAVRGENKECIVIPIEELIYKEWLYMSGADGAKLAEGNRESDTVQ